tara:strand:+ start:45 stop:149 length:105 start_codon:yes stop_codon:yes gene_type:complete
VEHRKVETEVAEQAVAVFVKALFQLTLIIQQDHL